jgi:DNA-binding CsgD family transcriptional regulator
MRKVPRETQDALRDVEDSLAHYSLRGDNIVASLEALREAVDTDKVFLYSLAQRAGDDDLMITRSASVGCPTERWTSIFDGYLRGRGVVWGPYNGIHPEPEQRDRVLRSDDLAALTARGLRDIESALYPQLGLGGHDTMRVLVCDGPSMLACVAIVQPEPTTERQRDLLSRLVPAFRQRFELERAIGASTVTTAALVAALEQVSGAAWVIGTDGRVLHANAVGRAQFDDDRAAMRAALEACAAGAGGPRFKVTPLGHADAGLGYIVIEVADAVAARSVPDAALRLRLTPAQTRVLERVARGISNARIAAELGVAERTVEAHVTAILEKAQVPSRAALIVQVLKDRRGH